MSRPPAPFVAIDGEATDEGYVLLASSEGRQLTQLGGLPTGMCFEFLLRTRRPATVVCFGLNYDVNNWLCDLPKHTLKALWETHVAYWRSYRIEWIPARWFSIKDTDGRFVKVHEVFGFFQTSFVKALEAWGVGAPAEIERMKAARGTFRAADIDAVTRYCFKECELLVTLMDQLRAACRDADIVPRSWIGAGAIAMALLGRQGMDHHHTYDIDLADTQLVEDVVLGAYFAGRIELLRQGVFKGVKTADIRSAYPAAATELPSLDGARLVHRKRFKPPPTHGIWRVRWDLGDNPPPICPFPVRSKKAIFYPARGEGTYHGVEVAAALAAGYPLEIVEGWVLKTPCPERPFRWIPRVFAERKRLQAEGHPAEKVVKLGLNSVYGKLAQGYGFNARPRWQSYFWAGYITAATRAKILTLAAAAREPLMIATDGVFCAKLPPPVRDGKALGKWELGQVNELFTAQAGVYQGITPDKEIVKSRGFFAVEVDYDALREGFEAEGADYVHTYDSHRFIGLGVALHRRDFGVWRRWVTEKRSLLLTPERKGLGEGGTLTPHPGPLVSEPYKPKVSLIDARALDQMQGADQPMKERI